MINAFRISLWMIVGTLLFAGNVFAQEKSESTLKFEFLNGYWVVSIKAQNSMATAAMKADDPNLDLSELGVTGFHKHYQDYLHESIFFMIDSTTIPLSFVALEMNSAKANGQFISPRMENAGNLLQIKSTTFEQLGSHITKLVVISEDEKHVKWLSSENEFTEHLTLNAKNPH